MKKFLSLLLAMIMVFSLSVAVFATGSDYVESPSGPVEPDTNVALVVGIVVAAVVVVGAAVAGVVVYNKKKK